MKQETKAHVAGKYDDGLQLCTRCGMILTDYRNAMVEGGSARFALCGWRRDSIIKVTVHADGMGANSADITNDLVEQSHIPPCGTVIQ